MQITLRCFLLPLLLWVSSALCAQDPTSQNAPAPITTDRPAFTDASIVVPKASLQVENGFLATTAAGQQTFDLPESLLRFGVASKTEFRFTVPDYFGNFDSGKAFGTGWGDLLFGIKQQLHPIYGFDMSLVVSLSFPTGAKGVSSHGYDPSIQLPWSRKLSPNWTVAGMLSIYFPTQGASRNVTGQTTFLFDRQLTEPWDVFIEYGGDFPERGSPQHLLHFGAAYKVTGRQQVDLHGGVGFSAAAPDHFIGVGYSVLFDRPR